MNLNMNIYMTLNMKKKLEEFYQHSKHLIPPRLLYSPKYFEAKRALECRDSTQQDAVRREQLRKILLVAKQHVPYYKSLAPAVNTITHEDPFELLSEFPYVEKELIMDSPQMFINERAKLWFAKYATTGGSTGRGIGMWRSKSSSDIERLFFNTRWGEVGYKGDRSAVLRVGAEGIRRLHEHPVFKVGKTTMLSPYHISRENISSIARSLAGSDFEFIHAYAAVFLELTYLLKQNNPTPPRNVKAIFLGSEPVTIEQLNIMHDYWKCPIVCHYGLTERTILGFYRYQPGDQSISYKLERLYSIFENSAGSAEVVGTGLWNEVMPLIRYRTKDHGLIVDDTISSLQGREQDFLIDRHGAKISGMSIVINEPTWSRVRQYQIRQRTPGKIELCIVPRHGILDESFKKYVLDQQIGRWGDFFDIILTVCDSIPLSPSGKSKMIDVRISD
ncbi:hypothetical protein [Pseudomonas sp. BN417]|uniref:hypothetical protein n=1 Tax=Pseudomonas sp. BN417 TaxID=2567890 RepID=UPI0024566FC7|nr:hypothetical protein [Pseudomonas sp. BN417]